MNIISKIAIRNGFRNVDGKFVRKHKNGQVDAVDCKGNLIKVETTDSMGLLVGKTQFHIDEVDDFDDFLKDIA